MPQFSTPTRPDFRAPCRGQQGVVRHVRLRPVSACVSVSFGLHTHELPDGSFHRPKRLQKLSRIKSPRFVLPNSARSLFHPTPTLYFHYGFWRWPLRPRMSRMRTAASSTSENICCGSAPPLPFAAATAHALCGSSVPCHSRVRPVVSIRSWNARKRRAHSLGRAT